MDTISVIGADTMGVGIAQEKVPSAATCRVIGIRTCNLLQ